jgi:hypothetical protein
MTGFRVVSGRDWQHVVRPLVELVPLVIIDTRDATDAVRAEVDWVLQPGSLKRVLFVSTETGALPALHHADVAALRGRLRVTTRQNCAVALRRTFWTPVSRCGD